MTAALFAIDIIITLALTFGVLREYGDLTHRYAVTVTVFIAWFFSYAIILILPVDVSATWYLACSRDWYCALPTTQNNTDILSWCNDIEYSEPAEMIATQACDFAADCPCSPPGSYISQTTLPAFWKVTYWTSQALTWLILPFMESYMSAGDFTFWTKCLSSLKDYALINGIYFVIGTIFLIYIAVRNHLDTNGLKSVVIALSNTTGLIFVMIFLGYGLVDVPRRWFRKYNLERSLKTLQFRAGQLSIELNDAEEKVDEIVSKVMDLRGSISQNDELRPYLEKVLKRIPGIENQHDYDDFHREEDSLPSLSKLAKLNKQLKKAQKIEQRCRCQWNDLMDHALELEDVIDSQHNPQRQYVSKYFPSNAARWPIIGSFTPTIRWYWKIWIQPVGYLIIGSLGALLSLGVVWSEVTFSTKLSIYAQIVTSLGENHQHFLLEVMTFITLGYMCLCSYRIVFNLRLFNFYYLVPKKQSDSSSLLYSGMALCRMTVPLCLNFLAICHMDNHVTSGNTISVETAFTVVMGHMDVMDFLNNFALYYPIIIVPVSLCILFNVHSRIMSAIGIHSAFVQDTGSDDLVSDGKTLIAMEKSRRNRGDLTGPARGQHGGATSSSSHRATDAQQTSNSRSKPSASTASPKASRASSSSSAAPPRRSGGGATRLQEYLDGLQSKNSGAGGGAGAGAGAGSSRSGGGGSGSGGGKSMFDWGSSSNSNKAVDERAESRRAMTSTVGGLGNIRRMFGGQPEPEDEIELLPTHHTPAEPPARSGRPNRNNFFDS